MMIIRPQELSGVYCRRYAIVIAFPIASLSHCRQRLFREYYLPLRRLSHHS